MNLEDNQDSFRATLWALHDSFPEQCRARLIAAADTPDAELRREAARTMTFLPPDRGAGAALLRSALKDHDAEGRLSIVQAVVGSDWSREKEFTELLGLIAESDPSQEIRKAARAATRE